MIEPYVSFNHFHTISFPLCKHTSILYLFLQVLGFCFPFSAYSLSYDKNEILYGHVIVSCNNSQSYLTV